MQHVAIAWGPAAAAALCTRCPVLSSVVCNSALRTRLARRFLAAGGVKTVKRVDRSDHIVDSPSVLSLKDHHASLAYIRDSICTEGGSRANAMDATATEAQKRCKSHPLLARKVRGPGGDEGGSGASATSSRGRGPGSSATLSLPCHRRKRRSCGATFRRASAAAST
ncbi:MAG: hypothetical protein J3K34DRAFT_154622 [Monoraphidium minutum]|nr:MAG: hypothetical protein J3K34DRAFT_154622 [Monoraphidium minutum]